RKSTRTLTDAFREIPRTTTQLNVPTHKCNAGGYNSLPIMSIKPKFKCGRRPSASFLTAFICLTFILPLASLYAADAPARREWTVDDLKREALVYVPPAAHDQPTPVIFAFHGHGGTMQRVARNWKYETLWPEA